MFLPFLLACAVGAESIQFERHAVDTYPAGYPVAVAGVNGDTGPGVIALSAEPAAR